MKKQILVVAAALGAGAVFAEPGAVTRVFLPERDLPKNDNITLLSPADEAAWIAHPSAPDASKPEFFRFRNEFSSPGGKFRFHVSADERFVLYLDGEEIARGPNRGFPDHWYFQSYEADLAIGDHRLDAVVWRLGDAAARAQLSHRGGSFLFRAEGELDKVLTTGKGDWKVAPLVGCYERGPDTDRKMGDECAFGAEAPAIVRGSGYPRSFPDETAYVKPIEVRPLPDPDPIRMEGGIVRPGWRLYPCPLPDQLMDPMTPGVRYGDKLDKIPAHAKRRLTWDLGDYYCAYPEMSVSGGKGAKIRWHWAESLRDREGLKGDRNAHEGKEAGNDFVDTFLPDGRRRAVFTTPWWRAGRWCQIDVETADEPIEISNLRIVETRYPTPSACAFDSSDPTLKDIAAISVRGIQMCSHEVCMDCPFYEQQMYPGDSRTQFLCQRILNSDDRLARSCIGLYDWSRRANGLVAMNFPTRGTQESATYSICWLQMLGDYLWNGADRDWLRHRLPGMRHTISGLLELRNEDGLLANLPGWSFVDWVVEHGWWGGNPPGVRVGKGESSVINLHFVAVLRAAAEIEAAFGEKELAAAWNAKADQIAAAVRKYYWDETKGMVADDRAKTLFSEHAQCLAILGDALSEEQAARAFKGLVEDPDLARMTVYFSYNLFDTYARRGRTDLILNRLDLWRGFVRKGLKTVQEAPDNLNGQKESRSDCHGWGSHPLYFMHRVLAGVSAAEPFFKTVRVAPNPASLTWIRATTPVPQGLVQTDLTFADGQATGTVTLPAGLTGTFVWKGVETPLKPGKNEIR